MKKISLLLVLTVLLTLCLASCGKCAEGNHDYVESVISEATSDTPGLSSFTCSVCGDTYTIERYTDDYTEASDTTSAAATAATEADEDEEDTEGKVPTGNYDSDFKLKSEKHINANESLLTIIDTTGWENDEWDIHDITVKNNTLYIECTAEFGTNLRFILNDGSNADVAVSTEKSGSDSVKGQKYEDVGKAVFDGDVTSYEEHFSADSEEFEMTIEIPITSEISSAESLYLKFNIELPTTSAGWSIDTYYLKLTFDR